MAARKTIEITAFELSWADRNIGKMAKYVSNLPERAQREPSNALIVSLHTKLQTMTGPGPTTFTRNEARLLETILKAVCASLADKTIPGYANKIAQGQAVQEYKDAAEKTLAALEAFASKVSGLL